MKAKQMVDAVLARTRDPGATVPGIRATTLDLLSRSELLVNTARPGYIFGVGYTVPANFVLIPFAAFAPGDVAPTCLRVMRVSFEGRDLRELSDWRELGQTDFHWLVSVGKRPRVFCTIGHDFLVIYPGAPKPRDVIIYYSATPTVLTDDDADSALRDDRAPATMGLTEVLLLLRNQDLKGIPAAIQNFSAQLTRLPIARSPQTEVGNAPEDAGGAGGAGAGHAGSGHG